MPLPMFILPLLAAAAAPEAPVVVRGYAWAPFISPMGEPFRARSTNDDTLVLWFTQADRNRDSYLTPLEMQADADRFFAVLDANRDGEIDPEEITRYEWEVAPEIQVNSKWKRERRDAQAAAAKGKPGRSPEKGWNNVGWHGGGAHDLYEGGARYSLLNIPQPVAAADADFDRGISLVEFRNAAAARFQLLDSKSQGRFSLQDLVGLKPVRPADGRRPKTPRKVTDKRIGTPLPTGD